MDRGAALLFGCITFGCGLVAAQPAVDPAKLAPVYQQQRNAEADGKAQCYAVVFDQQARIIELEKQLAAAKAASEQK